MEGDREAKCRQYDGFYRKERRRKKHTKDKRPNISNSNQTKPNKLNII